MIDRQQVVIEDRLGGGMFKPERPQPLHVPHSPVTLGVVIAIAASQQELAHAMARARQVLPHAVAAPARSDSSASLGGCTAVNIPERSISASFRASRPSVLIRSPGLIGIRDGATTSQITPWASSSRCRV